MKKNLNLSYWSNDRGKVGLYYIMDFLDNIHTRDPAKIEDIIIRKSGRIVRDDRLYLLIREFLVYVKSITITVETILSPVDIPLPEKPRRPTGEYISCRTIPVHFQTTYLKSKVKMSKTGKLSTWTITMRNNVLPHVNTFIFL